MIKVWNGLVAAGALILAGATLVHLTPLLVDGDALRAVLVTLPAKHHGLSSPVKIGLFGLLYGLALALAAWGGWCLWRSRSPGLARLNRMLVIQAIVA